MRSDASLSLRQTGDKVLGCAPQPTSPTGRTLDVRIIRPPIAGGVTDYAETLGTRLGAEVIAFDPDSLPVGSSSPETAALYVQFSGYGYQRRGVPLRLLRWLRAEKGRGVRIGVFFHELYAFGWPWNSSFWLSPVQRYITAEIAGLSDFWLTNRHASADWLLRMSPPRPHAVLAVCSNIGEVPERRADREPVVAVFGSIGLRTQTYLEGGEALVSWCKRNRIKIVDIGAPIVDAKCLALLGSADVEFRGYLPSETVRECLSTAAFGAVAYRLSFAAKSGVLAAYAACGAAPIIVTDEEEPVDGLSSGVTHFTASRLADVGVAQAGPVGRAAEKWYRGHCLDRHVEMFEALLKGEANNV